MERSAARTAGGLCRLWSLLLLLLGSGAPAHARQEAPPGELPFVRLELPEPGRVDRLTQDSEGDLWVAARGRLYRFDGRHFHRVPGSDEACPAGVRKLVAGSQGEVWCLGADSLSRWWRGEWRRIPLPREVGLPAQDFTLDAQGRAWLTTPRGLFLVPATGTCCQPVDDWGGESPRALWAAPSGELFLTGLGAVYQRGAEGRWRRWSYAEGLPSEQLTGVAGDGQGRVWVWSARSTWVLRPGARGFIPGPAVGTDLMETPTALDRQGRLWWANSQGLLHQEGEGIRQVRTQGLPQMWLGALHVDREGSLWVAGGAGLFRLVGRGLWQRHGERQGLPSERVWAIARDGAGQLWAGTQRGLARATLEGWEAVEPLGDTAVRRILPTPRGVLWLARGREVWRYEPRTGEVLRLGREQGLADGLVQALAWEPPATLWVGTSAGLFRGTDSGQATRLVPVELSPEQARPPVSDVALDTRGRLWAASVQGLFLVRPEGPRRFTAAQGLRATWVGLLAARREGELCVSYAEEPGLSCFRPEGEELQAARHLESATRVGGNTVSLLGEDGAGRLWVGGDVGVDVVALEGQAPWASHSVADGLPGDECSHQALLTEPDGTVWVGTSTGLGQFLGHEDTAPLPPPATLLMRKGQSGPEPLPSGWVLTAETGPLELEVQARTLSAQHAVEHQARLSGLDADFHPLSSPYLRYSGLEPGAYTLQVRSRLRHGAWGPVASLPFSVAPPWWRSPWVPVAGLLLLGLGATLGFRLRQHVLQRRNAELESLVSLRTTELTRTQQQLLVLEKAALEQRMAGGFAHEMRNALTGARLMLGRVFHGPQGHSLPEDTSARLMNLYLQVREVLSPELHLVVARLLQEINGNERKMETALRDMDAALGRALAITRQILEYAQLGRQSPGQEPVALRPLVQAILEESREALAGVELHVEVPETCLWRGRQEHFYSILKNLVLNALDALGDKPGEEPRRLRLEGRWSAEACSLRVEDTGVGIASEHRPRLFEPFFSTKPDSGTGLGLAMVARLVALYGGSVRVESEPGQGTSFTVSLPHAGPRSPDASG
jgi:signal transduction histidine kinase/ligand-binding sensor domain-containing protein